MHTCCSSISEYRRFHGRRLLRKHIKQNDGRLKAPIPRIGCFFRSCGLIAEIRTGRSLTAEQINAMWDWAKATVRIDDRDNVRDSASIATRSLRVLGDGGRFVEVGTFRDGRTEFYPSYRGTPLARIDALIQKVRTNGPEGTHFRVVATDGTLVEDPHSPPVEPQGIYYSILYAYVPGEA